MTIDEARDFISVIKTLEKSHRHIYDKLNDSDIFWILQDIQDSHSVEMIADQIVRKNAPRD